MQGKPGRAMAGMGVAALVVLLLAGCGLKTPPRPAEDVLPAPQGVRAWQRGDALHLAWQGAGTGKSGTPASHDGVEGWRVSLDALPMNCRACAPVPLQEVNLTPQDGRLKAGADGMVYLALPLPPDRGEALRVTLRARHGDGWGAAAAPLVVHPPAPVPAVDLRWRWLPGNTALSLAWDARRTGLVRTHGGGGTGPAMGRRYRANLYRRTPDAPWPLAPINASPIEGAQWIVAITDALLREPGALEFQLRLVDDEGNEGPPSAPQRVTWEGGTQ